MNDIIKKKIASKLKGRKHSATTRNKISQSLKGKKLSEKHKQHISEAMKRKWKGEAIYSISSLYNLKKPL